MMITKHARKRMAQRGIPLSDAELIELIGTEVHGGYLVRAKDCQGVEKEVKALLTRIRRLNGKRLVTVNGRIVTAFHASRQQERRLLRYAHECDLKE